MKESYLLLAPSAAFWAPWAPSDSLASFRGASLPLGLGLLAVSGCLSFGR